MLVDSIAYQLWICGWTSHATVLTLVSGLWILTVTWNYCGYLCW